MKLERKYFRSKVARRMLMFFMLSAFIPIVFLALLSYWESNRLLVKQAHTRLGADANIYQKSIYDRLLLVDQLLREAAQRFAMDDFSVTAEEHFGNRLRGLALALPAGDMVSIFGERIEVAGLNISAARHLSKGEAMLNTQDKGQDSSILMLRTLYPQELKKGLLVAEISPDYLWGDADMFAQDVNLCVLNENYVSLFCSLSLQTDAIEQAVRKTVHSIKGEFSWQEDQNSYLASYYEIFLEPKFFSSRWLVVAAQPEIDALGSMKTFNTIFWGSVTLAVLLIMLLSMIQIRRVLVPLEKLIDGTRRLGKNDFATKVDVVSPDEFGELAASFNVMSGRLGDQFETLTALSKIDREILSGVDIDKIAENVLMHLQKMMVANFACISVFDHDVPEQTRLYRIDENAKRLPVQHQVLTENIQQLLITNPNGVWTDSEPVCQQLQIDQIKSDVQHLFMLPLNWKDQMVGFISLGFRVPAAWQEELKRIQDYADRVAVALFTKNREAMLLRQARIDALTGLPNRFLFMEQLQKEIAQAQRVARKLAVLYIDLDRFKNINDSFGHTVGDKLLCEAGERLHQCVRESDTVARLGGDEFAIIINELDSAQHVITVAEQAIDELAKPFVIQGDENTVAASIGIAVYPHDGANIADLMRNSDIAMYRAKERSGSQYVFFEESMNAEVVRRTTVEQELRRAISEQQFVLNYQPQVDPKTDQVRGVEALVRWNHPERGIVSPGYFIAIAEDTGLIAEIGKIVLTEACAQYRLWRSQGIELEYVAVNVSVKQFRRPDFFQSVETVLCENAMPAHCLELEITESVVMDDAEAVLDMLHQLQHLGVQLSIDDFGTGYSSMSYLEKLPFDTLKIDMSFVRKIQDDGEGGAIAATIAAMAHALNKKVVAEGVETQAQLDFMRQHDCELIQGYFYSHPLPADELAAYVNKSVAQTLAPETTPGNVTYAIQRF
jgi:diguanylate cyclase (GGDEF)-like protein